MEPERLEIILARAPDDPKENDPQYQEELRAFGQSLRAAGVTFSQRAIAFDSIDAHGYPLGDFLVALAPTVLPAVAAIVVTWLRVRAGRKVRVKVGDTHVEARTAEEAEKLLKVAAEFRKNSNPAKRDTP